jgi:hypothetical protein
VTGSFVVTNIASTSITLAFDGQYNFVNIYNTTLGADASAVSLHNTGKKFINSNLQSNQQYTYIIAPFNELGEPGTTASLNATTAPVLTSFGLGIKDISNIGLIFDGSYSYVDIWANGQMVETLNQGKSFIHRDVSANTLYNYTITPYNTNLLNGESLYLSTYSLPMVLPAGVSIVKENVASLTSAGDTTAWIQQSYSGAFSYVDIFKNNVISVSKYASDSYVDASLMPNTTYSFMITPYNIELDAGSTYSFSITTQPIISSIISGTKTSTDAIQLVISGNYAWFDLTRNETVLGSQINTAAYRDTNNLIPGTRYIYTLTPYNEIGNAGIPYTFIGCTLPQLVSNSCYVSNQQSKQMIVNFDGSYSFVNIKKYNDVGELLYINSIVTGTHFQDVNLTPNTSYTYTIIPYNPAIPAQDGSSVTIIGMTLPKIDLVYTGLQTETDIQFRFNGNYDSVAVSCTSQPDIVGGVSYDTSYTVTGLNTLTTSYTFAFVPYDLYGVSGESVTIDTRELSLFTEGTISTGTVTTSSIELLCRGTFSTV